MSVDVPYLKQMQDEHLRLVQHAGEKQPIPTMEKMHAMGSMGSMHSVPAQPSAHDHHH